MLNIPGHPDLKKIVILNSKGGSGKSTLATNLSGMLASLGRTVALMDFDPQGSSMRWLKQRDMEAPPVHGIAAYEQDNAVTRSFRLRVPQDIRYVVIDTPAAMPKQELGQFTRGAHAVLLPVLPSDIDIHAAARFIADLLLVAKLSRESGQLGVIANRVRENTISYRRLMKFLDRLSISRVAEFRDTQNYLHASEQGLSIHELPPSRVRKDLDQWAPLREWLSLRLETPLSAQDPSASADEAVEPPANEARFGNNVISGVSFRRSN